MVPDLAPQDDRPRFALGSVCAEGESAKMVKTLVMTKRSLKMWKRLSCALGVGLLCGAVQAAADTLSVAMGEGRFEFTHGPKAINVWTYRPPQANPDTPILFVMHGTERDAERYRDQWVPHARDRGFIVVVPEFSRQAFPGSSYILGGTREGPGAARPNAQEAFGLMEPLFDEVRTATQNRHPKFNLYGHSAGAQFVHRFLYFEPNARVDKAVAANAGWWTLPDLSVAFPYGLQGSGVGPEALKTVLQRPLVILLGTADTNPNDSDLRQTPQAVAQGPHRLARGQYFYEHSQRQAAAWGIPLGWTLATAPGVSHSNAGMAKFAVELLYGPPSPSPPRQP